MSTITPGLSYTVSVRYKNAELFRHTLPSLKSSIDFVSDLCPQPPRKSWTNLLIPKSSYDFERQINELPTTNLLLSQTKRASSITLLFLYAALMPATIALDCITLLPRIAVVIGRSLYNWKWGKEHPMIALVKDTCFESKNSLSIKVIAHQALTNGDLALTCDTEFAGEFSTKRRKITSPIRIQVEKCSAHLYKKIDEKWKDYSIHGTQEEAPARGDELKQILPRITAIHDRAQKDKSRELQAAGLNPSVEKIFNPHLFEHVALVW